MYAPPPLGYAYTVWRYENTTMARMDAMMAAMGLANAERAHVDEDEHPQDLFGCVRHGRERIGGQDGQAGDAGETLVMGEM
jgi:hypothetical protein